MHNADIPLSEVREGIFLLLGDDPLLDEEVALDQFCEPVRVVGIHHGTAANERSVLAGVDTVVRAAGSERATERRIGIEVVARKGGHILLLFPDHRHFVTGVNIPDPPVASARNVAPHYAGSGEKGLVDYRLPRFWRDTSIVVSALPASWFGRTGRLQLGLDTLDTVEALGGVIAPGCDDVAASETPFHGGFPVGTAVLCWAAACGLRDLNPWALDGTQVAPTRFLVASFGSPGALRLALLEFVSGMLASEATDLDERASFELARATFAARLAGLGR